MIKNLIFDLGGVLVSLDRERCLGNFAKDLGFENFGDYLNAYAQKGFFAEFENGMAAEFELNEALPDTMSDICFVKGNYSDGHVTNQPVVGYFNEEGLICADDTSMQTLIAENGTYPAADGPFAWMKLRFEIKAERGLIPAGKQNIEKLAALIKRSLER